MKSVNSSQRIALVLALIVIATLGLTSIKPWRAHGQGGTNSVTTVSAASFAPVVTPDSIAAAFGTRLATRTELATSQPLPKSLAGTTVRVNGELAPLFFVSANQVNYLIPPGAPVGAASVVVTSSDGVVSQGTVQIAAVAPALFAANANGLGALASLLLRVKANGEFIFESLSQYSEDEKRFVTKAIEFGEVGDQLFLVLYLTGIRQAPPSSVRVNIGGVEYAPSAVAPAAGFTGLDQINLPLPRTFGGRGRITLFVKAGGGSASNAGEFEISAGKPSSDVKAPMQITSLPASPVLAGEEIEISGSGFAANPFENTALIVSDGGVSSKAEVMAVTGAGLRLRVPFGAGTGQLRVSRGQSEATAKIQVRTSVSGFIEEAKAQPDGSVLRVPIPGARVRLANIPGSERTVNEDGSFVMPDVPKGLNILEVTPPPGNLNYPNPRNKINVEQNRDNQLPRGAELAQAGNNQFPLLSTENNPAENSAVAIAPDAVLTFLLPGRTPANLPVGHFSTRIAQITPFGAAISPAAKLSFPNADAIPAGAKARLFKFDQTTTSETLGEFIDIGEATVTADGRFVETAANAINEGSYYFVSLSRPLAAINGRVVESDGRPAPRAIVQARGQSTFTDGFGGFVLRNVPVLKANGDRVKVEVSYQRPDGRISRKDGGEVELIAGELATVNPEIVLDPAAANFPPVILAPASLTVTAGETREFDFIANDPDSSQSVQVSLSGTGVGFTTLSNQGPGVFRLRLAPGAGAAGSYLLSLGASDGAGGQSAQSIVVTINPGGGNLPSAHSQAVTTAEDTPRAITLAGSDPSGRALTYTVVSGPLRGSLSGAAPNLVYTPARDYNGVDSFTFKVGAGGAESTLATAYIAVNPVNDAPALSAPGAQTALSGQTLNVIVSAADVDLGQKLNFTVTGLPSGATFAPLTGVSWRFSWTPTALQVGAYDVRFKVEDDGLPGLSESRGVRITVGNQFGETSGQEGGIIQALLTRRGNLYAGTLGNGVFLSTDQGRIWTKFNNGLTESLVEALAASRTSIFAGTVQGVFRLRDQAARWEATSLAIRVSALLVSGENIFAGTSDEGVFVSINDGQSWRQVSAGLPRSGQSGYLQIASLAANGGALFAGTRGGGVYRSTDNGQSWTAASNGLPRNAQSVLFDVSALAVSNGAVFAGTNGAGVYRSDNDGASWTAINTGLDRNQVFAFAVSGTSLFVGTFGGGGVARLNADGRSWSAVGAGLSFPFITSLAVSGSNLFAGSFGRGVFRTAATGAESWVTVNSGLTASLVYSMAVSGKNIYAGTLDGLFRSTNNGQSWAQNLVGFQVYALAVSGNRVFAGSFGVLVSSDEGATWQPTSLRDDLAVDALAVSGSNLFAGLFGGGVYRSSNLGQSWTPVNAGLTSLNVNALVVSGNTLFAGTTDGGVFRSTNQGNSWTPVNTGVPRLGNGNYPSINALAVLGATVYAGTSGAGVFRTTNNGESWTPVNTGLPLESSATVLSLAASGPNLFAGGIGVSVLNDNGDVWTPVSSSLELKIVYSLAPSGVNLFAGTIGGVFFAESSKQSWNAANNNLANPFVNTVAAIGANLFAGTLGSGVFRSNDQGARWAPASSGLPANANAQALAGNGALLVAGLFGDGVYRSNDQGASWAAANAGLANLFVNALSLSGGTLLAGTNSGVFRSTDQGQSWAPANTGLANLSVLSLTASGGKFYAGTDGGGVFVSSDQGQSWSAANNGLAARDVRALSVSGGALFAGTLSGGVFRSNDQGQSWTPVNHDLPLQLPVFSFAVSGEKLYAGTVYGVFVTVDQGESWKQVNAGLLDVYVTGLAVSGDQLFAGTARSGVFSSQIP